MLHSRNARIIRHKRIRSKISGTATRPRLAVFKSKAHIYVQLIDDDAGKTLASASDLTMKKSGTPTEAAATVGEEIANKAKELKLKEVVFDRGGFEYHGRVKALADGARKGGLQF